LSALSCVVQEDIESDKNSSDQLRHPISFAPYLARKRTFEKVRPNISVFLNNSLESPNPNVYSSSRNTFSECAKVGSIASAKKTKWYWVQ